MKISCPKARRGLQLFATMKLDFETMASNEILCCLISRFLLIIRNYIQLSAMRLYCNRLVRWKRELSFPYSILEKLAYARDYRPNSPIVTSPPDFTCLKQLQFFMQRCNIKWFILITFYVFFSPFSLQVRDLVEKCTCPSQFPMIRVSEGKYRIGDTKVLIFVRVSENKWKSVIGKKIY